MRLYYIEDDGDDYGCLSWRRASGVEDDDDHHHHCTMMTTTAMMMACFCLSSLLFSFHESNFVPFFLSLTFCHFLLPRKILIVPLTPQERYVHTREKAAEKIVIKLGKIIRSSRQKNGIMETVVLAAAVVVMKIVGVSGFLFLRFLFIPFVYRD